MGQHKKYKFALVGHSKELAEAVMSGINPKREELICKVVSRGEAIPVAKKLFAQGVEAIFGYMGNSQLMLEATGKPIIDIPRTSLDLIIAFKQAKKISSDIALSSYGDQTDGIDIIEKILNIRVHQMVFESVEDLKRQVHQVFKQGVRVAVGGGISTKFIESLGGTGILTIPRKYVINQAFSQARLIASINRKDLEQKERLEAILQMMDEGIIGTDQYGRLNIYNNAAKKILGLDKHQVYDQPFHKILKESQLTATLTHGHGGKDIVCKINGVKVVVDSMPIKINNQLRGAVALFRGANRIQNINRKVKESLYSKGFVASYRINDIIGQSTKILKTIAHATKYAATSGNILIQGETGTGKEMLAQAVHLMSPRKDQPFVAINCGAIPETLIESELFGHEEGAFTGARRGGKIGLIELADKGTLFLDEIADVSKELQMRLLRVIEEKEVMRIGGDRFVKIDVRVISSSYKDLQQEIKKGIFRPDLYYRLASLKLNLPPLRHRKEDIPLIIEHLIQKHGKKSNSINDEMLKMIQNYDWPGNIRELVSFIGSYFILLGEKTHDLQVFSSLLEENMNTDVLYNNEIVSPLEINESLLYQDIKPILDTKKDIRLKNMVETFEQVIIQNTLKSCQFSKTETAKRLGISINTLWRKSNLIKNTK
ncbi:MAG: sigma 54-interacting transcriptional regulator [Deltaproteobacteria bacterium]|jgi:transcriptional regulator, propionate catabolism operon regulatory protein|nr:sigma 54-interacting transcriptional regulator [Deltaproteobacteria bacterium]